MRRGTALLMGAVLMAAARLVPASGDTTPAPTPDLPRYACSHGLVDPEGDNTAPMYVGADTSVVVPKRSALDIRAIDLRLTDTELQAFMAVPGDPTTASMNSYESVWRFTVKFSIGAIAFTYAMQRANTADPGKDAAPADVNTYPKASMTGLPAIPDSTGKFVPGGTTGPSWVVFTSKRSTIEKQMGPIDPGTQFTAISGTTQDFLLSNAGQTDSTSATGAEAQYVAGDSWCFGPPPTSVTSLATPAAVFNHASALSAVLLDQDGKPLAGKPVTFTVQDGKPTKVTGTTDADGKATATYLASVKGGTLPVTATFPGDSTLFKTSSMSGTIKVSAEKTAFTAPTVKKTSATARLVTTTLQGDNKGAIAGVAVDWYVNGKKVATGKTDKAGKVSFSPKPGQTVQARFAGRAGMLLPAVSRSVKA